MLRGVRRALAVSSRIPAPSARHVPGASARLFSTSGDDGEGEGEGGLEELIRDNRQRDKNSQEKVAQRASEELQRMLRESREAATFGGGVNTAAASDQEVAAAEAADAEDMGEFTPIPGTNAAADAANPNPVYGMQDGRWRHPVIPLQKLGPSDWDYPSPFDVQEYAFDGYPVYLGLTAPRPRFPKRDSKGRAYGTGRRKRAVARVWIAPGAGNFVVNYMPAVMYFTLARRSHLGDAFSATDSLGRFDMFCTVKGGGKSAQAQAIKLGIAQALDAYDPVAYHRLLKDEKLLTRDHRKVERKHYGRKKARKSFTWVKR